MSVSKSKCGMEEDDIYEGPQKPTRNIAPKKCMKCGETACVLCRSSDPFCRSCFDAYFIHKFRQGLGKSRVIRDGENVLVAFSGGPASTALLTLLKIGLHQDTARKLRFHPVITYFDEIQISDKAAPDKDKLQLKTGIVDRLKCSGFPAFITTSKMGKDGKVTADLLDIRNEDAAYSFLSEENKESYMYNLLRSTTSLGTRIAFTKKLRNIILCKAAKKINCKKLMMADTNNNLAINLLTSMAEGGGVNASADMEYFDTRHEAVAIVRPLREHLDKEVAFFNVFHELSPITIPSLVTKTDPMSCVIKVTESFLTTLQADFPSTMANILRTSEKVCPAVSSVADQPPCPLCKGVVDVMVGSCSALKSANISEADSIMKKKCLSGDPICYRCQFHLQMLTDGTILNGWLDEGS